MTPIGNRAFIHSRASLPRVVDVASSQPVKVHGEDRSRRHCAQTVTRASLQSRRSTNSSNTPPQGEFGFVTDSGAPSPGPTASHVGLTAVADDEATKPSDFVQPKLKLVQKVARISRRELARTLDVSEATVRRIEAADSEPTDDFLSRLHALCIIGRARFAQLTDTEKLKVTELHGVGGGAAVGVGAGVAAVGAAGIAGFSAAGITSGLAAVGGGAMLAGIGVVAVIPVATALAGYGLVKGIKAILKANRLESEEVDGQWEIRRSQQVEIPRSKT